MASGAPDLQRFLDAQQGVYEQARDELAQGRKRTHWMWFIFPQVQGLGTSAMAERYAIEDIGEAVAYLNHPILGARLRECTALVNAVEGCEIGQILGYPDDLKFRSSTTLFASAAEALGSNDTVFQDALERYFDGAPDAATLQRL